MSKARGLRPTVRACVMQPRDNTPILQTGNLISMRKGEVECPSCGAWYRRIEVASMKGEPGEYACLLCGQPLRALLRRDLRRLSANGATTRPCHSFLPRRKFSYVLAGPAEVKLQQKQPQRLYIRRRIPTGYISNDVCLAWD